MFGKIGKVLSRGKGSMKIKTVPQPIQSSTIIDGSCVPESSKEDNNFKTKNSISKISTSGSVDSTLHSSSTSSNHSSSYHSAAVSPDESYNIKEMLEGRLNLAISIKHLNKEIIFEVDRKMPLYDVLVIIANQFHFNPADYTIIPDEGCKANQVLTLKSNPLGLIDTNKVSIVPKPNRKDQSHLKGLPFNRTILLKVNLPYNQLMAIRIPPSTPFHEIKERICKEKSLNPSRYLLIKSEQSPIVIDLNQSPECYNINQVTVLSQKNYDQLKKQFTSNHFYSSLYMDDGSNRLKEQNDWSQSTPNISLKPQQPDTCSLASSRTSHRSHKKKPAPPPPILNGAKSVQNLNVIHDENEVEDCLASPSMYDAHCKSPNDGIDNSNTNVIKAPQLATRNRLSRQNSGSDSSGYHEMLSNTEADTPTDSNSPAPPISPNPPSDLDVGSESTINNKPSELQLVKEKPSQNYSKLNSKSTIMSSLSFKGNQNNKKRRAPMPPPTVGSNNPQTNDSLESYSQRVESPCTETSEELPHSLCSSEVSYSTSDSVSSSINNNIKSSSPVMNISIENSKIISSDHTTTDGGAEMNSKEIQSVVDDQIQIELSPNNQQIVTEESSSSSSLVTESNVPKVDDSKLSELKFQNKSNNEFDENATISKVINEFSKIETPVFEKIPNYNEDHTNDNDNVKNNLEKVKKMEQKSEHLLLKDNDNNNDDDGTLTDFNKSGQCLFNISGQEYEYCQYITNKFNQIRAKFHNSFNHNNTSGNNNIETKPSVTEIEKQPEGNDLNPIDHTFDVNKTAAAVPVLNNEINMNGEKSGNTVVVISEWGRSTKDNDPSLCDNNRKQQRFANVKDLEKKNLEKQVEITLNELNETLDQCAAASNDIPNATITVQPTIKESVKHSLIRNGHYKQPNILSLSKSPSSPSGRTQIMIHSMADNNNNKSNLLSSNSFSVRDGIRKFNTINETNVSQQDLSSLRNNHHNNTMHTVSTVRRSISKASNKDEEILVTKVSRKLDNFQIGSFKSESSVDIYEEPKNQTAINRSTTIVSINKNNNANQKINDNNSDIIKTKSVKYGNMIENNHHYYKNKKIQESNQTYTENNNKNTSTSMVMKNNKSNVNTATGGNNKFNNLNGLPKSQAFLQELKSKTWGYRNGLEYNEYVEPENVPGIINKPISSNQQQQQQQPKKHSALFELTTRIYNLHEGKIENDNQNHVEDPSQINDNNNGTVIPPPPPPPPPPNSSLSASVNRMVSSQTLLTPKGWNQTEFGNKQIRSPLRSISMDPCNQANQNSTLVSRDALLNEIKNFQNNFKLRKVTTNKPFTLKIN